MTHKSTVAGVAGFRRLVRLKARPGASTALPFRSTFTMVMPRPQQCRPYALISGIRTGRRMRAHASSRFRLQWFRQAALPRDGSMRGGGQQATKLDVEMPGE